MTTEKHSLSPEQWAAKWNDLRHPMIATSSDTFAELKKLWEECVTNGGCKYATDDQKNQASNFFSNIDRLKSQ